MVTELDFKVKLSNFFLRGEGRYYWKYKKNYVEKNDVK